MEKLHGAGSHVCAVHASHDDWGRAHVAYDCDGGTVKNRYGRCDESTAAPPVAPSGANPTLLELARVQSERDAAHRLIDDSTTLIHEQKQTIRAQQSKLDALLSEIAALTADLARERRERAELQVDRDVLRRELTKLTAPLAEIDGPACLVAMSCVDALGVAESIRAMVTLGKIPRVAQPAYVRVAMQMGNDARAALGLEAKAEPAKAEVAS
ncbi:MAG TPA: hypothetical protein VFS06_03515 [Casimicrobiaceae bacterium]|nr:hypothetical protein [Casimicrobiaceae bacterium]